MDSSGVKGIEDKAAVGVIDHLRQGIHLRGYAQKNPKQEYKRESFELFSDMLETLKTDVIGILAKVQVRAESDVEAVEEQRRQQAEAESSLMNFQHTGIEDLEAPKVTEVPKVGRNEPCPCGSGKKYKNCHGKLA